MESEDLFYDERAELNVTYGDRPHWKQAGKIHFVTWRLADSIAQAQLRELEHDREVWAAKHRGQPLH